MKFYEALQQVETGKRVTRDAWGDPAIVVGKSPPQGTMTLPFLWQQTEQGEVEPYAPSNSDTFADDWQVLEAVG